jgi:protein N-terminal amidase
MAKKLDCYVFGGYPEEFLDSDNKTHYYNSAYFITPTGDLMTNYRKTHLYETDKYWCEEG